MDMFSYLTEMATQFGPSGHEYNISKWYKELFTPLCDQVEIDALFNVIALKKATRKRKDGKPAPKVMISAHQDEIALMVSAIEKDGSLRMDQVGGVDPRILPASVVNVHASKSGEKLIGVIGAKPPHLLSDKDRKRNYLREDLFVDCGLSLDKVNEKIAIGDLITLEGPATLLLNNRVAAKTMDDRACIAVMMDAAERLQNLSHMCDIYFVCSTQEEVGVRGARTSAYNVDPDMAYILDVTHATIPQSRPDTTVPLDAPAATYGPFIQHKLLDELKATAKKHAVKLNTEYATSNTYTDTDAINIARDGVPSVLLSLPLKYMHTSVELLDMKVIDECGRLLAHALSDMQEGWDDSLWI